MQPRVAAGQRLNGLASPFTAAGRGALAVAAAVMPARYWQALYRLPVREAALPSSIMTSLAGLIVWARGFMAYARLAADALAQSTLDAAARQVSGAGPAGDPITTLSPQLVSLTSILAFTLFTPAGVLAAYLTASGLLRIASVATDDAMGDPLLTALDATARAARARGRASLAGRRRAAEEGRETPDRLFTGEGAGLDGVDYAVVASRRKPGWTEGTTVVTADGWFRLGRPFDATLAFGLRTIYPLTRVEPAEVLRRAVRYDLPPLQRGPGRLVGSDPGLTPTSRFPAGGQTRV